MDGNNPKNREICPVCGISITEDGQARGLSTSDLVVVKW